MTSTNQGPRAPKPSAATARGPDTPAPRTLLDYLTRATSFLEARGVSTPRLDAEVLLAHVLATDRVGVYLRFDQPLAPDAVEAFRGLLRQRAVGVPVAYLTGRREFWSRPFGVTRAVLIPRPETELLVERALAAVGERERAVRILDLGTGSGALAVTLACELRAARVVAVDVSPAAAEIARANAAEAGVAERVAAVVADWTSAMRPGARFDLIVCNPPYVETAALDTLPPEVRAEPRLALDGGADGLAAYRIVVPAAALLLAPGGQLLVEVGEGQAGAVAALCAAAGLGAVACHRDLAGVERAVTAVQAARVELAV